jgi:RNA polymerase sigma-70 factor, ECF subfamily
MWAVAFRVLRNNADAEEIAQDTFLRAHRGLATFRGECSLSTWLHRIALNLARNRYWYFFRRQRHASMSLEMPLGSENPVSLGELIASDEMGPVREANATEFTQLVNRCMAGLAGESSEILMLRCEGNQSYAEISRTLGLSVGTVKSRLSRARERLRAAMLLACPEFAGGDESGQWFDAVRPPIGHANLSP